MARIEAREHLITNFGAYMKSLRVDKGITLKQIGAGLNISEASVSTIENNRSYLPSAKRVQLWLKLMGCEAHYKEALMLLRRVRRRRTVDYILNEDATEHLDRIIDAYETGALDPMDLELMKMIAIREYKRVPDYRKKQNAEKLKAKKPTSKATKKAPNVHADHKDKDEPDISFPDTTGGVQKRTVPHHSGRAKPKLSNRSEKSAPLNKKVNGKVVDCRKK